MATTAQPQYLYMVGEDLYRLGNASTSKLNNVRLDKDVNTYERNGVLMVVANGKGISLITEERLRTIPGGSWAWKLPANFPMPPRPCPASRHRPAQTRSIAKPLLFVPTI